MNDKLLLCPTCGSDRVIVGAVQSFMINTNEHYCHSIKTHDNDAKCNCLDCDWGGQRDQLQEGEKHEH